jgi:hypothetical protein
LGRIIFPQIMLRFLRLQGNFRPEYVGFPLLL